MRRLALATLILIALAVCPFIASADNPEDVYVVTTNWTITDPSTGAGVFNPGYGVDPDPGRPDYTPAYNDYDWMYTDDMGVKQAELNSLLASWEAYCQPEIDGVTVLNRIEDLQIGTNRIQMVVNHVVMDHDGPMKSMFTITFPPNYSIDAANRYPMVINGTGYGHKGLNRPVFADLPMALTRVKSAFEFDENNRGIVYVRWNMGGYHCMGVNDEAREALNAFIQQMHNQYGCDKHKIVTFGGSRAGMGALSVAQNTAHQVYDYTVVGVFSRISPLALGKLSLIPVSTYPAFASIYNVNAGSGAYRYTWNPPPGMNPNVLVPAFGPDEGGTPLSEKANALCPDHPDNLLALQGKYIWMSYSTHDCFFPLNHFIDMDNFLSNNGIKHSSFFVLQGGHKTAASSIADGAYKDFMIYLLNDESFDPGTYSPPVWKHGLYEDGRNYLLNVDLLDHNDVCETLELAEIPFSITTPYRLGCDVFGGGTPGSANEPGVVFLSGAANKDWEVTVRQREPLGEYGPPHTWSGTFDQTETEIIKWWPGRTGWDDFPVNATGLGGALHPYNDWLEWTVTYDGIDYSKFTNWMIGGERLAFRSEVMALQASTEQLVAGYLRGGDNFTGFGVDAIPALPWVDLTCTPASGTAPVEISCALTAGCYAPADRVIDYSVDITLADGTLLPGHWQGTMAIGPDESLTHYQQYDFYDESVLGINTYNVTVEDVTPAPFNQPPFLPSGMTNTASTMVNVSSPISDLRRAFQWLLQANPGWTTEGAWSLGQPTGAGGSSGGPDPASGKTGTTVYGYNLSGDYANNLSAEYLVTLPIDCTGLTNTSLRFWRWLGVDHPDYDQASIQVSTPGGWWVTVWANDSAVADTGWVQMELDISAWADDRSDVRVRWAMGPTNDTVTYCGWNVDDIEIWGNQAMTPTIINDISCIPGSGTVPFVTHMRCTVNNCSDSHRRVATQVDVTLASEKFIANWRRGYQNMTPQQSVTTEWNQTIPALGFMIGDNLFAWSSRDVTPVPYNQPPHAPSGSTDNGMCVVTGLAP